ncbi:MAG: bifunctional isocitrate dehydrogenase kinase/phosphatase, partial [Pseudomonadales bacterium]
PVLHSENGGLFIDTVLFERSDISIVFSFTRTYFMLYTDQPSQYVAFLKTVMPNKEVFELYAAIGFPKHAKTEFVRRSVARIAEGDDEFIIAPGIKGMVMLVFTLPSYEYVFKVIKDRFTPPKEMTREQVKSKYRLVKLHERAGRMADTQEFDNLVFDRERFSDELMEELHKEISSQLEVKANVLCLKHCYVERRMHPLNLYVQKRSGAEIRNVMDEYGNSIKQLAAANIFPGDMLLKNFGVTRHGRVVFYDYDEICLLTECNFRKIPEPRTEEQEMADTPWYSVAPNDVFPEEFRLFFSGNNQAREIFEELHSDLYNYRYWQNLQNNIEAGCVEDVYPYRRNKRFASALVRGC